MAILRAKKTWRRSRVVRPGAPMARCSALTPEEQANVRRALHRLREEHGSVPRLAKALGVGLSTLERILTKGAPTGDLAVRVARLLGASIDDVVGGRV